MTSPTHALVGLAIGSFVVQREHAREYLLVGALCAVVPDLDLLAPYLGGDRDFHRRFTHSIFFAGLLGIACGAGWALFTGSREHSVRLGAIAGLGSLSHTLTDMLTTYRLGVALMSPFSGSRYVLPWRPIDTLAAEAFWVALPAVLVVVSVLWFRRIHLNPSERTLSEPSPSYRGAASTRPSNR